MFKIGVKICFFVLQYNLGKEGIKENTSSLNYDDETVML